VKITKKRKINIIPTIPLSIILILVFIAIFAPMLTGYDPTASNLADKFLPPVWNKGGTWTHVFGTDYFGRDLFSRILYGARISLGVSTVAILISSSIGALVGMLLGYFGGVMDLLIMRIIDALYCIPFLVMAIAVSAALGASIVSTIFIMSFFQWPIYAKQVRAETLSIKERDYVALAEVSGASTWRIIIRHVFPNVTPVVLVLMTLHIGELILWESSLSFLGVGIPEPSASWGTIISSGQNFITTKPWLCLIPGLFIMLTVVCSNLIGDYVRDRLDPRLRQM
jgi:peptide/nickel transport system permease protein